MTESALIVSDTEKDVSLFTETLHSANIKQITVVESCQQAQALMLEQDFDLVVVGRKIFRSALASAQSAQRRVERIQVENEKLKQKIEDIRVVYRAKCVLIAYLNLSEQDAHRFIEKQAMDSRSSKREVAEGILKMYEN